MNNQAGKGDRPRNCFSNEFRSNYDLINWTVKEKKQYDFPTKKTEDFKKTKKHSTKVKNN